MSLASRILVVDDDMNASNALSLILSAGNFETITIAPNAEGAFELLELEDDSESNPPTYDVILLDVMMPGIDGIEACARIRTTRRYRDVPILMCTGLAEPESLNQAFIAGANDYLSKPFRKIELLARVRSAMRLKRELDRRRAREVELRKAQGRDEVEDDRYFDKVTGLPGQEAFNATIRRAADRDTRYGILALQIAQAAEFREEAGVEAFNAMVRKVAAVLAAVPAPMAWRLSSFADGLFLVIAPEAELRDLTAVGKLAQAAVDTLQLPHGHSAEHEFVRLLAAADSGMGSDLLVLPAEIIRSLDRATVQPNPSNGPITSNDSGTIAA